MVGEWKISVHNFSQLVSTTDQTILFPTCYPRNQVSFGEIGISRVYHFAHSKSLYYLQMKNLTTDRIKYN